MSSSEIVTSSLHFWFESDRQASGSRLQTITSGGRKMYQKTNLRNMPLADIAFNIKN